MKKKEEHKKDKKHVKMEEMKKPHEKMKKK